MNVSKEELTKSFDLMFGQLPMTEEEEAAAAAYDTEQTAKIAAVQGAYDRFVAGTNTTEDVLQLEKAGLVVPVYRKGSDDERPVAWRLKDYRDVDGNEYTDQAGLEENPGRL